MNIHFTYYHSMGDKQAPRAIDIEFTENIRAVNFIFEFPCIVSLQYIKNIQVYNI